MKIVMTGGHHSSALPVIEKLKESSSETRNYEIFWFGHKTSLKGDKNETLEYKEITKLGIPFFDLKAGKIYRTKDLKRLMKVPFGVIAAFLLLAKIRPRLIVSFGGYLAAPTVIAGKLLGIPSITHEQTVVAGYANKLISKFADKVMISWPQSEEFFPKEKVILTGLPLRIGEFKANSHEFDLNEALPVIYVTAGKTGSHIMNNVVYEAMPELLKEFNVIHQCGDNSLYNDFDKLALRYKEIGSTPGKYHVRKFIFSDNIGEAFHKADVVVSRSGAHIVAELVYFSKPCILIPIPWVSHNEQYQNAKILEQLGLGKILEQKDLSGDSLIECLAEMKSGLHDQQRHVDNEQIRLAKENFEKAAGNIVNVINQYYRT